MMFKTMVVVLLCLIATYDVKTYESMSIHQKKDLFSMVDRKPKGPPSVLDRQDTYLCFSNSPGSISVDIVPTRRVRLVGIYGICTENATGNIIDAIAFWQQLIPSTPFSGSSLTTTLNGGTQTDTAIRVLFVDGAGEHPLDLILETGMTYRFFVGEIGAAVATLNGYIRIEELDEG